MLLLENDQFIRLSALTDSRGYCTGLFYGDSVLKAWGKEIWHLVRINDDLLSFVCNGIYQLSRSLGRITFQGNITAIEDFVLNGEFVYLIDPNLSIEQLLTSREPIARRIGLLKLERERIDAMLYHKCEYVQAIGKLQETEFNKFHFDSVLEESDFWPIFTV